MPLLCHKNRRRFMHIKRHFGVNTKLNRLTVNATRIVNGMYFQPFDLKFPCKIQQFMKYEGKLLRKLSQFSAPKTREQFVYLIY